MVKGQLQPSGMLLTDDGYTIRDLEMSGLHRKKRDTSLLSVIKKGYRKIIHGEKGNMALKSVESENVEFKSNRRDEYLKVI